MKKLILSGAVSLGTLGLIAHLLRRGLTEQVGLWPLLRDVSLPLLLVYIGCQLAQTFFRSERYRSLLRGCGEPEVPGHWHSFLATTARNAMVDLLPARTGELGYLAIMNRGYKVRADNCLGAMAVSFLLDMIALALVLAVALAAPWNRQAASWPLLLAGMVGVLVVSAVGAAGLFAFLPPVVGWLVGLSGRLTRLTAWRRLLTFLERVARAIRAMRAPKLLLGALGLSLGVRLFKYGGLYAAFLAVVDPHLPSLAAAEARHVLPALLAAEGAAGLPIPALLGFGVYEGGGTAAWRLMGFSAAAAMLAMLALHIVSQSVDYLLGALAGVAIAFGWSGSSGERGAAGFRRRLRLAAVAGCLLLAAVFAAWQWRSFGKMGRLEAPGSGQVLSGTEPEIAKRKAFAGTYRGRIVWSSNRHGYHDILSMELPSTTVRRLTASGYTDTYPRLSSDGERVLFSRSREPWVSQRNPRPWDTWLIDLATGRERLVATNAFMASWSAENRFVFQRDGVQVMQLDLVTGEERLLFEAGRGVLPEGVQVQTPDFDAATGALAITLRGARRMTAVAGQDGTLRPVGGGDTCQLGWLPQNLGMCLVGRGGRMRNAILRVPPGEETAGLWFDMPEPYSHEYFPKMDATGRLLVFGASTGGHEHDSADYEIFVWPVGAPEKEAVRLTFHSGNDCWPDIRLTSPSGF